MFATEARAQAEDVLGAVRAYVDADLPHYSDSLRRAYEAVHPLFARPQYHEFFWHCASTVPGWLAAIIFANARVESEGSAKLLRIWRGVDYNADVEGWVMAHAKDESRHSRVFLKLAAHAFPALVSPADVQRLDGSLPDVRRRDHSKAAETIPEETLLDYLVQINIGEIRTRVHMHLFGPVVYAFAPDAGKAKVAHIVHALERDEVRHIGYTASLMEAWAASGDCERIERLYRRRLAEFHEITIAETEAAVRDFGQGRFPELLEL